MRCYTFQCGVRSDGLTKEGTQRTKDVEEKRFFLKKEMGGEGGVLEVSPSGGKWVNSSLYHHI